MWPRARYFYYIVFQIEQVKRTRGKTKTEPQTSAIELELRSKIESLGHIQEIQKYIVSAQDPEQKSEWRVTILWFQLMRKTYRRS